jgi:hypothetical protein
MAYLHEITLGDPRRGVMLADRFVLKLGDERFKMIKVGQGKVLLKGSKNKFLLERLPSGWNGTNLEALKAKKLAEEFVVITLWGERTLFSPPQIHLLRALLGINCTCKMCRSKHVGR